MDLRVVGFLCEWIDGCIPVLCVGILAFDILDFVFLRILGELKVVVPL
jgi:hypothetical protein